MAFLQRLAEQTWHLGGASALTPFPGPHGPNLPSPLTRLAGFSLQPGFRAPFDVAGQEIPARSPLGCIGTGQRRHRPPRPCVRILPRLAGILAAAGQDIGGRIARKGHIAVGRPIVGSRPDLRDRRDRACDIGWIRCRLGLERSGLAKPVGTPATAGCDGDRSQYGQRPARSG